LPDGRWCRIAEEALTLNEEFSDSAWVEAAGLGGYHLNVATVDTFRRLGLLPALPAA
jgi:hypothetical protein